MAETVKYYLADNIIAYPTSNSERDIGKLNVEENMEAIVTRLTTRNFCLAQSDFSISAQPDADYGHVIQIEPGQANIQGYHVITNTYLRVPPPTSITGTNIALGMKLERDTSSHLLGDVTENLVTRYEGIWVSYFKVEDAKANPDIFILGYLDWDGSNFNNVYDNPEKLGKFNAKDIICYLSDPKHPNVEFMNLQDWIDIVPDWYISKEGDVTYGAIDFLPGRLTNDNPDSLEDPNVGNKLPGIHIQSESDTYNVIKLISTDLQEAGHYFYIKNDDSKTLAETILDFYYDGTSRGSLYVRNPDNWLNLYSSSTLNLFSKDNTNIHSEGIITNYIDGKNNLKTELAKHNIQTNPLWEGASFLADGQELTLNKSLNNCRNGVVLVWSQYNTSTNATINESFAFVFIRKNTIVQNLNRSFGCLIANTSDRVSSYDHIITKYVNVSGTRVVGWRGNNQYQNAQSVLRAVYEW